MSIPPPVLTDSYKLCHAFQYPPCRKLVAYGAFRSGFEGDKNDTRIVFYGIRYILEKYVMRQWTLQDLSSADVFFSQHLAPAFGPFPYPEKLFRKFILENNGFMPITLQALPEGTCIHPHVPVYQITAEEPYAPLVTYLETLLTMVWYPATVATLSRRAKQIIEDAFEISVEDGKDSVLLHSRLHDFGFRGCTCLEQSIIGGTAHLLNFTGSDTMSACYYAQYVLNEGKPVGSSIPATEHSVMTAWPTEREAILSMIDSYGTGIFATVMDSYDYQKALEEIVPSVSQFKNEKGGFWVLRPDSGDPVQAVLQGLRAADAVFGSDVNAKGFKVPRGAGVIQGDGVNTEAIRSILAAVMKEGFSAQSVAFGMGAGLLQKVNRDSMSFATKLCHIVYEDGTARDVLKMPRTDPGKESLPGILAVKRVGGVPMVFPAEDVGPEDENLLRVVYDKGPLYKEGSLLEKKPGGTPISIEYNDVFEDIRARIEAEWHALPPNFDAVCSSMKEKKSRCAAALSHQ